MANTLTSVVDKLLAQMLDVFRTNSVMPRLVHRDLQPLAAQKGSQISVPLPPTLAANDVTAAATPPSTQDTTTSEVIVTMSNWREVSFQLSDKEQVEVMDGAPPRIALAAAATLIDAIDASILTAMDVGAGAGYGTAGTTPFATLALTTQPFRLLTDHRVAREGRHCVFNAAAEANLLGLEPFTNVQFAGDVSAIVQGTFNGNTRLGAKWWVDQNVATHAIGTSNSAYQLVGAHAVGATSLTVDTGSGTILAGDVITLAGDTNKYVVGTALTGGVVVINAPGLKVAAADNTVVSTVAAHVANFAFHQDCVAFVSRPFALSASNAVVSQMAVDPISGLALRLEVSREHKRDRWSIDALWGTKVLRPEGVIKVLG